MKNETQEGIKGRIAIALRRYCQGSFPCHKYVSVFGCSSSFMREFIEEQFLPGMTWGNNGKEWQIDHILPLCAFDQKSKSDIVLCWNWVNLRPLPPHQNKARNSYTEAVRLLERRLEFFPENPVIRTLILKAQQLVSTEVREDWTKFIERGRYVEQSIFPQTGET